MKLRNEGAIQPPPVLRGPAGTVANELQSWPGLEAYTHWMLGDPTTVDGAEFHVDGRELGHIHLGGEVHLMLTIKLRDALVRRELAQPFRWGREWVDMDIETAADAAHARWLFQIGYDRLRGVAESELLRRIDAGPQTSADESRTFAAHA